MRTKQRLLGLKEWLQKECCVGRLMKTPGSGITEIAQAEPRVFLAWFPKRPDESGMGESDPENVVPSILVMPNPSRGKMMEEKRFDRYSGVKRPKDLGQTLAVSMLLSVWEPGNRLPGFAETGDMKLLTEGTEDGLFTLYDWMDTVRDKLLSQLSIPGTDLLLDEESVVYSLYTDQSFVVDKRPIFYGFVNAEFYCYAETEPQKNVLENLL